jgi:hypothetical protein
VSAVTATSTTGTVTDLAVRAGSPRMYEDQGTCSAETFGSDATPIGDQISDRRHPAGGRGAEDR